MAMHDTGTPLEHNLTEPMYKQIMDLSDAAERYTGTERFANTAVALSNIILKPSIGPHVTINNILLPETRGSLDAEDYVVLKSGAKRNMGTVPPQNMNKTVNTGTLLNVWQSSTDVPSYDIEVVDGLMFVDLLKRYPKGRRLPDYVVKELQNNYLTLTFGDKNGNKYDPEFFYYSGYLMLLQDALAQFEMFRDRINGYHFVVTDNWGGVDWAYDYTYYNVSGLQYDYSNVHGRCTTQLISDIKSIYFTVSRRYIEKQNGVTTADSISNGKKITMLADNHTLALIAYKFGYDALAYVLNRLYDDSKDS